MKGSHTRNLQIPRSQRRITADVLEGEDVDNVDKVTPLDSFALTQDDTEVQVGDAEIRVEVQMGLDADGVNHAVVRYVLSGRTKEISLKRNG